ncbi:hypothetical protein OsJ_13712 [Oryza sativa Japonica Group]|uniref:DUF4220 domain-containing protein n=2 Tax=Oryza sativa subsp. japonica TaxID=39947 RepID=B9FDJ5_ORYSJ|nr:hypothetical protein OsJ_13712 [Oryza sativa Japonica Group]
MDVWNEWAPQILVVLSFTLQLLLLLLAGIRQHRGASCLLTAVLKGVLWLAYQLADSTAIYAIGHLSLCDPPPEHQLVPFWAPFYTSVDQTTSPPIPLRTPSSGSDTWFLSLCSGSHNSLRLAAVLMFTVGVIKYGERTWVLRCGNIDTIRSSLRKEPRTKCYFYLEDEPRQRSFKREADEEEFLVRHAHALFHICKFAVVDDSPTDDKVGDTREANIFNVLDDKEKYALMGIELSLLYDVLYTKLRVIHTCIGYSIRVVSPLATAGSLLIFQFGDKDGQHIADIAITYVLLTGAVFLEVISVVMGVNRYFIPSRRRFGSMGQYNMFHLCTRRGTSYTPILGWLVKLFGQDDLWERYHYSGDVEIPEKVKEMAFKHINRITEKGDVNTMGVIRKNWGQRTMERFRWEPSDTYMGAEFQEGIIIWHIATELFLSRFNRVNDQNDAEPTMQAIKALSNYMMFLLVARPDMLPGLAQNRLYQRSWKFLYEEIWPKVIDDPTYDHPCWIIRTMFKELFSLQRDEPNSDSWRPQGEKLASKLLEVWRNYVNEEEGVILKPEASRVIYAVSLADKLKEDSQLLLEMWIDFLVYAANRCSRESHAKKLNDGGELTTVLWLLTEHIYQLRSNK